MGNSSSRSHASDDGITPGGSRRSVTAPHTDLAPPNRRPSGILTTWKADKSRQFVLSLGLEKAEDWAEQIEIRNITGQMLKDWLELGCLEHRMKQLPVFNSSDYKLIEEGLREEVEGMDGVHLVELRNVGRSVHNTWPRGQSSQDHVVDPTSSERPGARRQSIMGGNDNDSQSARALAQRVAARVALDNIASASPTVSRATGIYKEATGKGGRSGCETDPGADTASSAANSGLFAPANSGHRARAFEGASRRRGGAAPALQAQTA
ncbi:unnamed protein product [Pedinophyceae sp. YPF-701]|nr:unnamed protein product [Pedinophyceae sp. YPF-701]